MRRWILAASVLGSSMAFLDLGIVNVALADIQTDLGADAGQLQWVVEAYALMLAALLLVGGALGDRFGRRRVFGLGAAAFAAASVLCALAPDPRSLILARGVQGIAAAALVPGSLALIAAGIPRGHRGKAYGVWAAASALTSSLGPVIGGGLVDVLSWRAVFWINPPIALAVLWTLRHVPESRDKEAARLDIVGAVLAALGLGGVVWSLIASQDGGWSLPVQVAAAGGAAALAAFVWWEHRTRRPMMPPGLWRDRTFSGANGVTMLVYAALGGAMFWIPLRLIQVQGYTAVQAGLAMLPFLAVLGLLSTVSGAVADRVGKRPALVLGPIVAGAGFWWLSRAGTDASYWADWFPGFLLLGLGMAVLVAPLTAAIMDAVPERRSGIASGVNNAVARTAGLLAVAAFGVVMTQVFLGALDDRVETGDWSPDQRADFERELADLGGAQAPEGLPEEERERVRDAVEEAFAAGFGQLMQVAAALCGVAAILAWWTIGRSAEAVDGGGQSSDAGEGRDSADSAGA